MNLENKKIIFLGDSITQGCGATTGKMGYVETLKRLANLREVVNCGIGGTRIAKQTVPSVEAHWDWDFVSRVEAMDADVDAVVVFGGTNDFGTGDAPFGKMGDTSNDTFCGACYMLMKLLLEKYPATPVVFATPLHRVGENTTIDENGRERKALSEHVDVIRKTAEQFSVPVLDLYAKSGMQPEIDKQNEYYFADGLHPNDTGHLRIAKLMAAFLQGLVD